MRDINVFGNIGRCPWDEGSMSAAEFARQLKDADGDDVTVHINSGGGNAFDANAMAETLRAYKGHVTASIEGLAASAASYFALTADEVVIGPSALLMIHNPWSYAEGESKDMRKAADLLDTLRGTISRQYVSKTGMSTEEVERMMDEETWFTAEEAVSHGFADRLSDAPPVAACLDSRTLGAFRHAPESLDAGASDTGGTIEACADETATGAVADGAGAASRVVCVNGAFLNVEGKNR